MEHDFWHTVWLTNQTHFHRPETHPLLARYWAKLGIHPNARVLVPLCGKSQDLVWLARHHQRILGVELSEIAVNAFFAENLLLPTVHRHANGTKQYHFDEITILCGDFFAQQLEQIDAIYDRAALIALAPSQRMQYAKQLSQMLTEQGKIMLMTVDFPEQSLTAPPYIVDSDELAQLFPDFQLTYLGREIADEQHPRRQQGLSYFSEDVWLLERCTT